MTSGYQGFHRDVVAMCDLFPRSTLKPEPTDIFCGTPPLAFTPISGPTTWRMRAMSSAVAPPGPKES